MGHWSFMTDSNYSCHQGRYRIILIGEEHSVLRASLRDWVFANFATFYILEARDGQEAISLVSDQKPDMILIDPGFPPSRVMDTLRRIRHSLPTIQLTVLVARDLAGYRGAAVAAGANAYIVRSKIRGEPFPVLTNMLSP